MTKKVTFADVAAYTGFSKTTISRYFNNPDSLTLENQAKIKEALDVLGYQENKLARVLANGKSEFIGIIVPNLFLNYYAEMLNLLLSSYNDYHYKFLVFPGESSKQTEMEYIEELLAYKIEGLIVLSHTIESKVLAAFNIPIVTIERESDYVSSVTVDNYVGGVLAARELLQDDCDYYLHINTNYPTDRAPAPAFERITGYRKTLEDAGKQAIVIQEDFGKTYKENRMNLQRIFEEIESAYPQDKVKGVFLANDTYASIFLNFIFKKYGTFPDTYKLVGFDNTLASEEAIIPITTIAQPKEEMAAKAMELLVKMMEDRKKRKPVLSGKPEHVQILPELIHRETT